MSCMVNRECVDVFHVQVYVLFWGTGLEMCLHDLLWEA